MDFRTVLSYLSLFLGNPSGDSGSSNYNPFKTYTVQDLNRDYPDSQTYDKTNLEEVYSWKVLKYNITGISSRNLPPTDRIYLTGLTVVPKRIFLSTGRVFGPVPASFSFIPKNTPQKSPLLQPYPNWEWHREAATGDTISNCNKSFVNVYRSTRDKCNRIWVLDSGTLFTQNNFKFPCPPKIVIFDMNTDQAVKIITLPSEVVRPNSAFDSIFMDDRSPQYNKNTCEGGFVYLLDTLNPAIVVYNPVTGRFWRRTNVYMYPEPKWGIHFVAGQNYTLMNGVRSTALIGEGANRLLYVQPTSSNKVYSFPVSELQKTDASEEIPVTEAVVKPCTAIGLNVDRSDGSLIFGPLCQSTLVSMNPHTSRTKLLAYSPELLQAVQDIRHDPSDTNILWLITTRQQKYFLDEVNTNEINQRVLRIRL